MGCLRRAACLHSAHAACCTVPRGSAEWQPMPRPAHWARSRAAFALARSPWCSTTPALDCGRWRPSTWQRDSGTRMVRWQRGTRGKSSPATSRRQRRGRGRRRAANRRASGRPKRWRWRPMQERREWGGDNLSTRRCGRRLTGVVGSAARRCSGGVDDRLRWRSVETYAWGRHRGSERRRPASEKNVAARWRGEGGGATALLKEERRRGRVRRPALEALGWHGSAATCAGNGRYFSRSLCEEY
jgi:hypothetical protein